MHNGSSDSEVPVFFDPAHTTQTQTVMFLKIKNNARKYLTTMMNFHSVGEWIKLQT